MTRFFLISLLPSLVIGCAAQKPPPAATTLASTRAARQPLFNKVALEVEPSLHGKMDRLPFYLDVLHHALLKDARPFAFNIQVDSTHYPPTLRGYVEFPEQRRTIDGLLQRLHLTNVHDAIEMLPSPALGENRFAVVTNAHSLIYDRTTLPRTALTDCSAGDVLFLLARAPGHFLCHAANGYVGYVAAADVRPIENAQATLLLNPPVSTTATADIEKIIRAAKGYIGTKYVWGGLTKDGIDCSGLVYATHQAIGLTLARDADQQALAGKLVATRWYRDALRRGDLLYFLGRDGSIHHTAIYLGNQQFLEATEPAAKISSFDPNDRNYSVKRDRSFCFAKRLMQ